MTLQTLIIGSSIAIGIIAFLVWLGKQTGKRIQTARAKYYKDMESKPYFIFNITSVGIKHALTSVYLNHFKPLRMVFKDLQDGDFSETQFMMVRDDGAASYNTLTAALAAYKPAIHLACLEITADRAGRFTVIPQVLPGYDNTVSVDLGFTAYKELTPPDFVQLARNYRG